MKMKDSKLLLKILSAFAAVILWFAITYTEDPVINQLLTDINVVFEGENTLHNNGLIVINKDSIPDLSATIRGARSNVIASVGAVSAVIDVSGITQPGENTVTVKYNYPSSAVTLAKTKIKEVTIEAEKIVSRNIPVNISVENADKNTEYIIDAKSDTSTVRISGAGSAVYGIAYAKVSVDVTNITASGDSDYFYQLCAEDGTVLPEKNILPKSQTLISVKNTAYKKVSLPIEVVLPEDKADQYALDVKKQSATTVFAGVSNGVNINTLFATFDGDEADEKTAYTMKITVPQGVYVPEKDREITAECTLVPKVLKELEVSVSAENVPEGKKVKLTPDKIRVSAKGAESLLVPGNIKATVDVSKLSLGTEKNLEVKLSTDKEIQLAGTYTVSAILE